MRHGLAVIALMASVSAWAGPPFVTDDPEPVERFHTEVNVATQATRSGSGQVGTLGAEANYGCAAETQCHIALPGAFAGSLGPRMRAGIGDAELGVKYRFLNHEESGTMAAIYPTLFLPTGNASRGLGNGRAQLLLPLWLQESVGGWTWDAGVAYLANRAAGARGSWYTGVLAQHPLGERLKVGAEVFHRTPAAQDAPATSGFNVGAVVKLTDDRNLLVSIGRGLQAVDADQRSFYLAYQLEL